jgi:aspartyl-tRNA(Asn)/glutamyl-tRNA(Gln) amidotransferase subunit B
MVKIGLEVHVQLDNCKSKLFCSCSTKKSKEPNTRTCPTCLGMPGSKPQLNRKAVESTLKAALALKCKINSPSLFSRKTYFFPDLAKNFQITQFETPIGLGGEFEGINLKRLHLEEDPASLIHRPNQVLVDYNRSGIPLLEIVTQPEIKSSRDARRFVQAITVLMEYLEIYNKKSQASLRCDVNISVEGGERVEIKNVGSAYDVEHALEYEIKVQEKNPSKIQQTKGWDANQRKTYPQRVKELEDDYGYIAEPDLPKLIFSKEDIKNLKEQLPSLAEDRVKFYTKTYKISEEDAKTLASSIALSDLFEDVAKVTNPSLAAKWIRRELVRVLNYQKLSLEDTKIESKHIIDVLDAIENKKITVRIGQKMMEDLIKKPFDVKERIQKQGISVVENVKDLENIAKKIIKDNQKVVNDFKSGEENALNFLMGQVMKETKGAANPNKVKEILKKIIA